MMWGNPSSMVVLLLVVLLVVLLLVGVLTTLVQAMVHPSMVHPSLVHPSLLVGTWSTPTNQEELSMRLGPSEMCQGSLCN
jgi:hypothetical protein